MEATTQIKVYHYNVTTGVETQLDVDPSDSSGDNKSRDHLIQALWHDEGNQIIWGLDCDNDGTADNFDVWKLDYSGSETSPAVTEVGTSSGADANSVHAWDIFKISTNIYVIEMEAPSHDNTTSVLVWDVDTAPFTLKDHEHLDGGPEQYSIGYGVVNGTDYFVPFEYTAGGDLIGLFKYDSVGTDVDITFDTLANYSLPSSRTLHGVAYDNNNIFFFIGVKNAGPTNQLCTYNVTGDALTDSGVVYNVALMVDRNTDSSATPEAFALEKGFDISNRLIYQITRRRGNINLISDMTILKASGTISAITDTYLIFSDKSVWKFADLIAHIVKGVITHDKEDWPDMQLVLRRDKITITKNLFMQFFGTYSANSDTNAAQVIFEGLVKDYDDHKRENVLVENQASEIDHVEPSGSFSGLTNSILNTINANSDVNYITDGTFSAGQAMGAIIFGGDKVYYRIISAFKDQDEFTWYLKPIGSMFYDDATVDTGADLLRDQSNSNAIWHVEPSHPSRDVNRVVVKGALNATIGAPYSGSDSNAADQQLNGIIKLLIRDATLDSNSLCNAKATNVLSRDNANPTKIRFAYRKTSVGFIQPGQTFTFSYITNDVSISSTQYIVDRIVYDIKTDIALVEASSGLLFEYALSENYLPEENSQLIEQNASEIVGKATQSDVNAKVSDAVYGAGWNGVTTIAASKNALFDKIETLGAGGLDNVVEDETPQLGGTLDCNSHPIVDEYDDEVQIDDDLDVTGSITVGGTVDGVDIADRDHDKYTDAEVQALSINNVLEDTTPQLGGDLDLNTFSIDFPTTANISDVKDEDNMASNSATMLATQQSIKAYVDAQVATQIANVVEDTTPQLGGDLDLNGKNIDFPTTANISDVLDEDNMASNSATKLATQQSIKAYVDAQAGGVSQSDLNALLAIGSANRRYISCIAQGGNLFSEYLVADSFQNTGSGDYTLILEVPLPTTLGALKLYIDRIRIGILDADAGDYLSRVRLMKNTAFDTWTPIHDDGTNRTAPGEYDYDPGAPLDVSDADRVYLKLDNVCTNAADLDITTALVRYYYDT